MKEYILKNWKTSVTSSATAFLGFVAFSPEYFPAVIVALAKYAALGGLIAFGIAAKDSKKSERPPDQQ